MISNRETHGFSAEGVNTETKNLSTEHGSATETGQEEEHERFTFYFTRYYSVMPNQKRYYMGKTYEEDFSMNCQGNCLSTADGHTLKEGEEGKVVACPIKYIGKTIYIENYGEVVCHDTGGAIKTTSKGIHLDLRAGIGDTGRENIEKNYVYNPGPRKGYFIN